MKNYILLIFLLFTTSICYSQKDAPEEGLGINLERYEYPFPVSYLTLDIQKKKYQMAYMDVMPEEPNGQNIMLLHGKNFNGAYWGETAKALAEAGFRVIIPDQIGFGKSSKPEDFQYTFQQLALNTRKLLDTLGVEKTSVLGHSMGGMLATRFVLMFPELVDKFILENPIGLEDWKLKVPYQPIEYWYKNELKNSYESIKQYQLQNYYGGDWEPEYEEWVNILAGWTKNIDYPRIAWNAALTYDMIFTQPVVYEFDQIKAPTLLLIGQRDRTALGKNLVSEEVRETMGNYQKLGRETVQKIPNSQLIELDDVGHLPHIEAFNRFINPLISFLKN